MKIKLIAPHERTEESIGAARSYSAAPGGMKSWRSRGSQVPKSKPASNYTSDLEGSPNAGGPFTVCRILLARLNVERVDQAR
jgi:hypothetical protein